MSGSGLLGRRGLVAAAGLWLAGVVSTALPAVAGPAAWNEVAFDQAAFDAAQKDGKPILIHITADWCSTCRAQKPILDALRTQEKFKPLIVYNVDFDTQQDLVRRFRATAQSTMIVFKGRLEEARMSGDTRPKAIALMLSKAF